MRVRFLLCCPRLDSATLAAETFGTRPPARHLPLAVVRTAARVGGFFAGLAGKIPDLEYDATAFLHDDYIVDTTKLKETGFQLAYPDFKASMLQMRAWYRQTH